MIAWGDGEPPRMTEGEALVFEKLRAAAEDDNVLARSLAEAREDNAFLWACLGFCVVIIVILAGALIVRR